MRERRARSASRPGSGADREGATHGGVRSIDCVHTAAADAMELDRYVQQLIPACARLEARVKQVQQLAGTPSLSCLDSRLGMQPPRREASTLAPRAWPNPQ